ncbi:MAG: UDP-N-acetylglucosamine 1-carboxyvinyltransferase [Rhodothermales bacterium]|jgi:UDP-N-acetylglucosamine 1-carboxyvinyltransferase
MDKLVVRGGTPLYGTLEVSGSKNTALALMAGALLANGKTTLGNVPALRDIHTFSRVIRITGAGVEFDEANHRLVIDGASADKTVAPYSLVKRMRASFYMLGALLGRFGKAKVSLPGGCAWGPRPVDLHMTGMAALGAEIDLEEGYVIAKAPGGRLPGGTFDLHPSSVGATINLVLGASTARGGSRIGNAAIEPDVVEFCNMLAKMGARIEGIGTRTLEIEGVDALHGVDWENSPDRIEAGTFMIAAAIAGRPGETMTVRGVNVDHLGAPFMDALRQTGVGIKVDGNLVHITRPEILKSVSISTDIFPGFPTDLQAQWTVLLACAEGNARIRETVYLDRFKHIPELRRMNTNAIVIDGEVVVEGGRTIKGAHVMSTDLRASVSLVLAGLVAEGETHVLRVYHLDRGYENLEQKLNNAGADIRRERYDEWADPEGE